MIRSPQPKDAVAIAEICRTALGHQTDADRIRPRIVSLSRDNAYYFAVYEDNSHVVQGFLQAQRYELLYGEDGWNIIALAVAPQAQGTGIGKALLRSLESHALAQDSAFIRLNSRTERTAAHAFYQHLGYTCDKTQLRLIKYIHH